MELVGRAKELAEERKNEQPVLAKLTEQIVKFKDIDWSKVSNDRMEVMAANISGYLFTLSDCINDAKLEHSAAELMRKTQVNKAYFVQKKGSQLDRMKLAEIECSELYENEAIADYYYKTLQSMYHNLDKTISILQSIMSNRRAEMRASKTQA